MSISKFLAVAFMCHQRPDRSFFIRGKQFPICARCTGILIGYVVGIVIAVITRCRYNLYFLILLLPLIIDGGIQQIYSIESNNIRRLITGILAGIGIVYLFISIHLFTVMWVTAVMKYFGWI